MSSENEMSPEEVAAPDQVSEPREVMINLAGNLASLAVWIEDYADADTQRLAAFRGEQREFMVEALGGISNAKRLVGSEAYGATAREAATYLHIIMIFMVDRDIMIGQPGDLETEALENLGKVFRKLYDLCWRHLVFLSAKLLSDLDFSSDPKQVPIPDLNQPTYFSEKRTHEVLALMRKSLRRALTYDDFVNTLKMGRTTVGKCLHELRDRGFCQQRPGGGWMPTLEGLNTPLPDSEGPEFE